MSMNRLMLIVAAVTVILMIAGYFDNKRRRKQRGLSEKKEKRSVLKMYTDYFIPDGAFTFLQVVVVKLLLFTITTGLLVAVHFTNVSYYHNKILTDFDYKVDIIYEEDVPADKKAAALQEELYMLTVVFDNYPSDQLLTTNPDDLAIFIITYGTNNKFDWIENPETLANKVYHRAYDYYDYEQYNLRLFIVIGFLMTFLTELGLNMRRNLRMAADRANLAFLKKMFVVQGSIFKRFDTTLNLLLVEATPANFVKLERVANALKKNTVDTSTVIQQLGREATDRFEKLFWEKLNLAYKFDFTAAIANIKTEEPYERQDLGRRYRKHYNSLSQIGGVFIMFLLLVAMFYFIIPWMAIASIGI